VNSSNSYDRLSQAEEQNYEVETKNVNFFVNSSPEVIVHLVQKALLTCKIYKTENYTGRSPEICSNALKLDLSEQANQMGALVVRWDL